VARPTTLASHVHRLRVLRHRPHGDRRIDFGFRLPDAAFDRPESDLTRLRKGLVRVAGEGCFLRCLLPVRLTGGVELCLGIEIPEEDLLRGDAVWDDPAYAGFTAAGRVANLVKPWGEEILGAELFVDVRDVDELPVARSFPHPVLSKVIGEEWDRDRVLSRFGHALPLPVRVALDDSWLIERTAGMEARSLCRPGSTPCTGHACRRCRAISCGRRPGCTTRTR
jgi:hypothetical protein